MFQKQMNGAYRPEDPPASSVYSSGFFVQLSRFIIGGNKFFNHMQACNCNYIFSLQCVPASPRAFSRSMCMGLPKQRYARTLTLYSCYLSFTLSHLRTSPDSVSSPRRRVYRAKRKQSTAPCRLSLIRSKIREWDSHDKFALHESWL